VRIFLEEEFSKLKCFKTVGIKSLEDPEKTFLELVHNTFKSQKDVSK